VKGTALMHRILLAVSNGPIRLFRQNVGLGWIGKGTVYKRAAQVTVFPGDVLIRQGRPFHAGIEGMSDLGGWKSVVVTPEMVGKKVAIYCAVEIKGEGDRPRPAQRTFIQWVKDAGGIADFVYSEQDAKDLLT
jgi:hypothetical protein